MTSNKSIRCLRSLADKAGVQHVAHSFILTMFLFSGAALFAQAEAAQELPATSLEVEWAEGLLSVDARNADIAL